MVSFLIDSLTCNSNRKIIDIYSDNEVVVMKTFLVEFYFTNEKSKSYEIESASKSQLMGGISSLKWYEVGNDIINLANVTHVNMRDKEEVEAERAAEIETLSRISF